MRWNIPRDHAASTDHAAFAEVEHSDNVLIKHDRQRDVFSSDHQRYAVVGYDHREYSEDDRKHSTQLRIIRMMKVIVLLSIFAVRVIFLWLRGCRSAVVRVPRNAATSDE